MSKVIIVPVRGHYEAYLNGKFFCSGDTEAECEAELNKFLHECGY